VEMTEDEWYVCVSGVVSYRVTTHLENLEKSKVREFQSGQGKVRENGKSQGKVRGSEIRCIFASSKYSKTRFSAGALPRTPLGEL